MKSFRHSHACKTQKHGPFCRSDGAVGVQVALGGLEHDKALKDLDVAAFSRAPREAMARSLEYIE